MREFGSVLHHQIPKALLVLDLRGLRFWEAGLAYADFRYGVVGVAG